MATSQSLAIECDMLFTGGTVITLDASARCFPSGAVAISGDTILAVGEADDLNKRFSPKETLHAKGKIILPGLVNSHNHTPLMIVRGMIEDRNFAPSYTKGIPEVHSLSYDETLALARLGCYELLRSGATTIVDYYRHPQALLQAIEEVGLRAVIGGRIHDADTEALAQGRYEHLREIGTATLQETCDLIESAGHRKNDRIRIDFAPHAADTCSLPLLVEVASAVEQHGGNVHTHLAQSRTEVAYVKERNGRAPHEVFADAGLLDSRLIAAHCVFLEPEQVMSIGQAKVNIAHAPHQNLMAGNIAPIRDLEAAGARITLCTDTRSGDLFETMRQAIASARIRGGGFDPKAFHVLQWATTSGAAALGMETQIGSLEPGKKADLIMLDQNAPNLVPLIDYYGIIVHSGHSLNVDTVVVSGQVLLKNSRPVTFDGDNIVKEAQSVAIRMWQAFGISGSS